MLQSTKNWYLDLSKLHLEKQEDPKSDVSSNSVLLLLLLLSLLFKII